MSVSALNKAHHYSNVIHSSAMSDRKKRLPYLSKIDEQPGEKIKERVIILVLLKHRHQVVLKDAGLTENASDVTNLAIATQVTN